MKTVIVSIDPGKTNLAWTILSAKGKLKSKGLVKETYTSLAKTTEGKRKDKIVTEANVHVKKGLRIIKKLIKLINTKTAGCNVILVYERFIPRGRFNSGNLTEVINMVIGQLIFAIKANEINPMMAATWKKRAKEQYLYTEPFNKTLPQHIVDAYCIGLFYLNKNDFITTAKAKQLLSKMRKNDYGWKHSRKEGWNKPKM